jgi:four helix bundle protein
MTAVGSYLDLRVWRKAMRLAASCYRASAHFPREEWFGLRSQLRRAAVSVVANIAEGNGRFSSADYVRHLSIANGSLRELETHLRLSVTLGYVASDDARRLLRLSDEIGRMIVGLSRRLRPG